MLEYIIILTVLLLILSFPYIRLFFKRAVLLLRLKRNKKYTLEGSVFSFFSPARISRGFSLVNNENKERIDVYIITAYNRRETLEITDTQFRTEKRLKLLGGRVGSGATMSWPTEFRYLPGYITEPKKNRTYLLFNPVPLDIKYNYNYIYLGDTLHGAEIVTGSILLSKID